MNVERIYIRPNGRAPQTEEARIHVVAGKGIEGDRYFGRADEPRQIVTFVESEAIEAFLRSCDRLLDLSATGRNIVTRGVRLNDLVGKEFIVGQVRFRGVELCEPCNGFGRAMASAGVSPAQVVKRMLHRAGLRADALSTGEIKRGATVESVGTVESFG
jgi:MOSC domain-containing protein YiiM